MVLTQQFLRIQALKFSFAKSSEFAESFARDCGALSMYGNGFGLGIPKHLSKGNQLRAVFHQIILQNGIFLFNISGINLKKSKKGFANFDEAYNSFQITEWELYIILQNKDYLKSCIFHNGKIQFKKRILWNSIM